MSMPDFSRALYSIQASGVRSLNSGKKHSSSFAGKQPDPHRTNAPSTYYQPMSEDSLKQLRLAERPIWSRFKLNNQTGATSLPTHPQLLRVKSIKVSRKIENIKASVTENISILKMCVKKIANHRAEAASPQLR